MLRILHLTNTLSQNSGILNVVMNYYRHLDRSKIQFDFLCFETKDFSYEDEIKELGGNIYKINTTGNPIRLLKQVKNELTNHNLNYTIIHYHTISLWGVTIPFLKWWLKAKIIIHAHNSSFSDSRKKQMRNQLVNRFTNHYGDYFFACSNFAGKVIFNHKQFKKCLIIPNAIDYKKFIFNTSTRVDYRESFQLTNNIVLGCIGRLCIQKNQTFLIEVMNDLVKIDNRYKLVLVGEGDEKKALEHLIDNYDLNEYVLFLDKRDDINNLLSMFDLFLLPSLYEGLGIVLLEAQANGLKCIGSTNIPKEVTVVEDNIVFIDLNKKNEWVEYILHNTNYVREDVVKYFDISNYYIKNESRKLVCIYLDIDGGKLINESI